LSDEDTRAASRRRWLRGLLLALGVLTCGIIAYRAALHSRLAALNEAADARLSLVVTALDATVERFRYLPTVLAQSAATSRLLQSGTSEATADANAYLDELNRSAGAAALFVLGTDGVTLAASNYRDANGGFLGRNYAFRPYYRESQSRREGRYYAVGATTGQPGYFLWHAIVGADRVVRGVAVVKVDLRTLEARWRDAESVIAVADPGGVVILTDRPDWRYRPLRSLDAAQARTARETRQYGAGFQFGPPLFVGERTAYGHRVVDVTSSPTAQRSQLLFTRALPNHGWSVALLHDFSRVRQQALLTAVAVMLALLTAALVLLTQQQRRVMVRTKLHSHRALEQRVAERTAELATANARLSAEIDERTRTERDLGLARDNLEHAAKMASLGTALAGVAHEINQSLAAQRTYVAGARVLLERGESARVADNLGLIARIVDRMASLTEHLKSFARKDASPRQPVDLAAVVRAGLALIEYRVCDEGITLQVSLPPDGVYVIGNAVRLEQVVVNLVSNALDAMQGRDTRCLRVQLISSASEAVLTVEDTGRGVAPEQVPHLFDPFYTTKDVGQGLGLGLSIAYGIVRDAGGRITVDSTPGRGSRFEVLLPRAAATTRAPVETLSHEATT
jgi:two-component system, NtrC family, C4-dicarboxylate transport sensor histidine kinase DctB